MLPTLDTGTQLSARVHEDGSLLAACHTRGRMGRARQLFLFVSRWESTRKQSSLGEGKSKVLLPLCKVVHAFISLGRTSSPKAQGRRATSLPTYQGSHTTAACHGAGPALPHQWSRLWPRSPTQPGVFHIPLCLPQVSP